MLTAKKDYRKIQNGNENGKMPSENGYKLLKTAKFDVVFFSSALTNSQ